MQASSLQFSIRHTARTCECVCKLLPVTREVFVDRAAAYIADPEYLDFFTKLVNTSAPTALDRTILFLVADHGIHIGKMDLHVTGSYEHFNPLLKMVVPRPFLDSYPEIRQFLKMNQ